ncbi:hypothetical protein BV25DRAFT_1507030 [Artomyces pyxidatus]|uniref:Uncharacterized protein n=1 Tax=Artomyces pyxidatus TaxID=48021 RepID=A0ACB8TCG2_9AGAM|nr:hypothetical protein BV25DRAFT_1507030 [Artomyces pyxidatus]
MAEPNRMCLPCSWDDECLLLGEPLLSQFAARKVEGRRKEGLWTQNIARSVMEDKDAVRPRRESCSRLRSRVLNVACLFQHDAAQKWLHIAFSVGPDEPPRPPESLNEETCQIFVRICWLLYDKERARAEGLLKDELLNRGYGLWPSEGEESSEESSDSRATPKSDGKVRGSSGTQDVPREASTGKRRAVHGALSIGENPPFTQSSPPSLIRPSRRSCQ